MAGYLSGLFPRCKISPKLNGTAPHFGDEMFALVLFVCYLDGGCEDIVVDVYNTEQQCLYSMSDQRIRHGGCFPIEDFIDGFWRPAQETVIFNYCNCTRVSSPPKTAPVSI